MIKLRNRAHFNWLLKFWPLMNISLFNNQTFQKSIEIPVDVYEGGSYELLMFPNGESSPWIQKFIAKDIPLDLYDDEHEIKIQEAEHAIDAVPHTKKKSWDKAVQTLNTLVWHNKDVGYLRYLQGYAMDQQAEQYRSNEKLKKSLKVLDDLGRDESAKIDVRNKALALAQE